MGAWIAFWMAFLVISLKSTRRTRASPPSAPNSSEMCQAIASPSRSGSVAMKTRSAFLAARLMSERTLALPLMTSYWGRKPFSTSTPIFDLGKSFTWPTDAFTSKLRPRYFLMVLALAGDSTITRVGPPRAAGAFLARGALFFFFGGTAVSVLVVISSFS